MSDLTAPSGFRLRTWEYPEKTYRTGLVCDACGFCADPPDPAQANQRDLDQAAGQHVCPDPQYEWDAWHRQARAEGVPPELAELGRDVYREAVQHGWPFRLDGDAMIDRALERPAEMAVYWELLLLEEV